MLGSSGRQTQQATPFQDFNEEVKELTMRFFKARENCGEESLKLLHTNQRFLKHLEDLKRAKEEVENRRNNYVDQATVFALRDAELRYQKACLLDTEKEWADMISNRHEEIKAFRLDLEKQLQHYCDERRKTATVQTKVTNRTEDNRINSLNSVAFCTYAQTIVETEVKKLCAAANLPTTRNVQRIQKIMKKATQAAKNELTSYYEDRIKEFKRQERILYGRGRDAAEIMPRSVLRPGETANGNNDNNNNGNGNGNNNGNGSGNGNNGSGNSSDITAEMLVDTIENRIATKLLAGTMDYNRPDSQSYRQQTAAGDGDGDGGAASSHRLSSSLTPAPPSANMGSSSGKNGGNGGRRTLTQNGRPSMGLRASILAQHQQQILMQQQPPAHGHQHHGHQHHGGGHSSYGPRGHRRFSLLQVRPHRFLSLGLSS
jgi:hypothetical protein